MDRRDFLQSGAAALAAGVLGGRAADGQGPPQSAALTPAATTAPGGRKLQVDAYSRHLQWLRSPDDVAKAVIEMSYTGLDVTVRPYPGHVDPAKVATDLPVFVKGIRAHGIEVRTITSPIMDADSQYAEETMKAAAALGIHHCWWGTYRYEAGKPVMEQLDALKPRLAKLEALCKKYDMKAMYHTYSMPQTVGCHVWDMLYLLRNFDPKYLSLHWDVGHTSVTGGNGSWAQSLRAAGAYVGGLSVKEYTWQLALETPEGGPFTGKPEDLQMRFGRPGGAGGPGGPGGGPGGPGAGGPGSGNPGAPGRPAATVPPSQQGGVMTQAQQQEQTERGVAAGAAAGGAGRRGASGPAGAAGPGGAQSGRGAGAPGVRLGGAAVASARGGGGQPLPWHTKAVPLGEGINNLPLLATVLAEINFDGPVEIQAEYPNGGAENAQDKLTLPPALVLGNMKRDLLALKAAFGPSGLL